MQKKKNGERRELPGRSPGLLVECRSREKVEGLFDRNIIFEKDEREHGAFLRKRQDDILEAYNGFSKHERAFFFSLLYDRFAERYDTHMGMETLHFTAMKHVLWYSSPFIQAPILDITAGTGEMLLFLFRLSVAAERIGRDPSIMDMLPAVNLPDLSKNVVVANEISPKMRAIAEKKLAGFKVAFTSYNAVSLPSNWRFGTVLCSQTMHLLSEKDKKSFVQSIHSALRPGGHAIVIEEDPFLITRSEAIDGVSLFIRAVAAPIKHHGTMIAYFENEGFEHQEHRAVHPIDSEHVMRLHVFRKHHLSS